MLPDTISTAADWPFASGSGVLELRQSRNAPPPGATPDRAPPLGNPDDPRFSVRVIDNSVNTYQEVIAVCCAALGVSAEEGFAIAQAVDTLGSCVVCEAPEPEARRVASIIGTIGIEVRLEPVGPIPLVS
ncbi:MAG TPA: hypothetical protein VF678_08050 [bacterium]